MTTFAAPGLEAKVPDPSKHVNYTLGMVLGVDDFNQDFAYTNAQLHWLARDAIGYGTLVGLKVATEVTARGPRVTVTSGAALLPPGRLVCVKTAQCGYVNDWLSAHKAEIASLVGSPLSPTLPLYLALCHRECPVDPVPIPGEPCRSESELMAPSRLADDFVLELRTTPPDQREEDLLREFVAWMRLLSFGGSGSFATVDQFIVALRDSVQETPLSPPGSPLTSPLGSPGVHFSFGSPLLSLNLDPALAGEYFRAAFRIWVTEIRPRVHPSCCTCTGGCGCGESGGPPAPDHCLLLARLDVPVVNIGAGEWRVDDTRLTTIDESRRPVLLSLRVLQEWIVTGGSGAAGSTPAPVTPTGPTVVAAGITGIPGADGPVFGGLNITAPSPPGAGLIRVAFTGYTPPDGTFQYVVKALAIGPGTGNTPANPVVAYLSFESDHIAMRVTVGNTAATIAAVAAMRFMVEVTRVAA
jgi:hypothetical protein